MEVKGGANKTRGKEKRVRKLGCQVVVEKRLAKQTKTWFEKNLYRGKDKMKRYWPEIWPKPANRREMTSWSLGLDMRMGNQNF